MNLMKSSVVSPLEILKRDVECFHVLEYTGTEELAIHVSPQAVPGIVFQHQNGQSAIKSITTSTTITPPAPPVFLYGPGIEPSIMKFAKGSYTSIQVILKPHALNSIFGVNASTLPAGFMGLNELSTNDLHEQLLDVGDINRQITLLSNFLIAQLQKAQKRDTVIEESLGIIHRNIAEVSVRHLLKHLNISERQFQRRFSQTVGISPQSYIRVKRFNEAVRLLKTDQYNLLTDIAYALNFYDQSHLIRDFKAFSGITPKNMGYKENDFYHTQTGYSFI